MRWTEWLTLVIAVIGAVTGVYGVVRQHFRDTPKIQVSGFIKDSDGEGRRLRVKLVNTGHVPVTVEKVLLTDGRGDSPKSWELWEHVRAKARLPRLLEPGDQSVVVIDTKAIARPVMDQAFTVMAQTADGRSIKASRTNRSQLAPEMQALAKETEEPAKG